MPRRSLGLSTVSEIEVKCHAIQEIARLERSLESASGLSQAESGYAPDAYTILNPHVRTTLSVPLLRL